MNTGEKKRIKPPFFLVKCLNKVNIVDSTIFSWSKIWTVLLNPKDFQSNSVQTHEINATRLTGIQNDNKKANIS